MRRALVGAALLVTSILTAVPADGQVATTAAADRGTAAPGEELEITGGGWVANGRVQVSVCGNQALRGSTDCDLPGSRTIVAGADGGFRVRVPVALPPQPCPCVAFVTGEGTATTVRIPLEISGAAEAPQSQGPAVRSTPGIELRSVRLEGSGPWISWFGGPASRDLVLTLRNVTEVERTPRLSVAWGTSETPTHVVDVPSLDPLAPGEERRVRVPITADALTIGRFHVGGSVSGAGPSEEFATASSTHPWGLLVAAVVLGQMLLLKGRNRLRDRIHRTADDFGGVPDDDVEWVLDLRSSIEDGEPIPLGPVPDGPLQEANGHRGPPAATPTVSEEAIARELDRVRRAAEDHAAILLASVRAHHEQAQAVLTEARAAAQGLLEATIARADAISRLLDAVDRDATADIARLRAELDRMRAVSDRAVHDLRVGEADEDRRPPVHDLTG